MALGQIDRAEGRADLARVRFEEARALQHAAKDSSYALTLANIGLAEIESGDLDGAADLLAQSVEVLLMAGDGASLAAVYLALAYVQQQRGLPDEAASALRAGFIIAREYDNRPAEAFALVVAAYAATKRAPDTAARLVAAAEAAYERLGRVSDAADIRVRAQVLASLRDALDEKAVKQARKAGRRSKLDDAVREALYPQVATLGLESQPKPDSADPVEPSDFSSQG